MSWVKYRKVQNHFCPNWKKKTVAKTDKDGNESVVIKSYKIKFIDSARFMPSLLSNLNLTEGNHKIKRKGCFYFLECKVIETNLMKN